MQMLKIKGERGNQSASVQNSLFSNSDFNQFRSNEKVITKDVANGYIGANTKDLNNYTVLTIEGAKILVRDGEFLFLNGITKIDREMARELAKFEGQQIKLNGLKNITPEIARELANFKGNFLSLDGLTNLDTNCARELSKFKGGLISWKLSRTLDNNFTGEYDYKSYISMIKDFDEDVSKVLDRQFGDYLSKKNAVNSSITQELVGRVKKSQINLNGLKTLNIDVVRELKNLIGCTITLSGLTQIDGEVARELPKFISINPNLLTQIDVSIIKGLIDRSNHRNLYLNGVPRINIDIAKELAKFPGNNIYLDGLEEINPEIADELGKFEGHISLNGLKTIDADSIRNLGGLEKISLEGLTQLDADAIRELFRGYNEFNCKLNSLTTLDSNAAGELIKLNVDSLQLGGLTNLDIDTIKQLSRFSGNSLYLGLRSITSEIAKELAKYSGDSLNLSKLIDLDHESAQELSNFEGKRLWLNGLSNIDGIVARDLAKFKGNLRLDDSSGIYELINDIREELEEEQIEGDANYEEDREEKYSNDIINISSLPPKKLKSAIINYWEKNYIIKRLNTEQRFFEEDEKISKDQQIENDKFITKYFQFFCDMAQVRTLHKKEELYKLKQYKENGDSQAKDDLILSSIKTIIFPFIIKQYRNHHYHLRKVSFLDVVHFGTLGIMKAIEKFNSNLGGSFRTYAWEWVHSYIIRCIYKYSSICAIPVHFALNLYNFKNRKDKLSMKLSHDPNDYEILKYLGLGEKKILDYNIWYPDADNWIQIDDICDTILDERFLTPDEFAEKISKFDNLYYILDNYLSERESLVLSKRFGLHYGSEYTLGEVGNQMEITRERVRQIEQNALIKLREHLGLQKILGIEDDIEKMKDETLSRKRIRRAQKLLTKKTIEDEDDDFDFESWDDDDLDADAHDDDLDADAHDDDFDLEE